MPRLLLQTEIYAPIHICFDVSRSIDVHMLSTAKTQEKAVAGVTSGMIDWQETVTWQARHFGIRQKLTSVISEFDRPNYFVDEMVQGAFKSFRHEHRFTSLTPTHTLVTELFDYTSPLGWLGQLTDKLFLARYMTKLLKERNQVIKEVAETGQWKKYLCLNKMIK